MNIDTALQFIFAVVCILAGLLLPRQRHDSPGEHVTRAASERLRHPHETV